MKKALISALIVVAALGASVAFTGSPAREHSNDKPSPWSCCMDEISRDG